ncbi:MAG: hypothetical protein Q7U64_12165 [Desulfocapsaceae bacterium]|nr:hypothetical protein [Desulfocapsaceae bacterium]
MKKVEGLCCATRVFLLAVKNKSEPTRCQVFDYKEMGMKTERKKEEETSYCKKKNVVVRMVKTTKGVATK